MEGERIVVCVSSLTALLQYVDPQRAYRFLNSLTNQFASLDAHAHYHLNPSAVDDQVVCSLSSLFDDAIGPSEEEKTMDLMGGDDVPDSIERFAR
jgi:hypothetical protein